MSLKQEKTIPLELPATKKTGLPENCRRLTHQEAEYLRSQGVDPSPVTYNTNTSSYWRPLTTAEADWYRSQGIDPTGFTVGLNITADQTVKKSPTPDDLKNAIVYMDSFLGMTNMMIVADVISMKPEALKFRFNGRDFDYSGHYEVILRTPRRHKNPYLGFGSAETAKLVILENGQLLKYLKDATIWEKSSGFIVLVAMDKEWIYSGPYSIQK